MALAQVSASLSVSIRDASAISSASPVRVPVLNFGRTGTAFTTGSPLIIRTCHQRKVAGRSMALSIKSEQSTKEGGLDVWLGRLGMVGFSAAIGVEIATGKGLLEVWHLLWTFYEQNNIEILLAIATVVRGASVGFLHGATKAYEIYGLQAHHLFKTIGFTESYHSHKNFGLTEPLPTAALAVTALVGVLTAVFIFQSGSDN